MIGLTFDKAKTFFDKAAVIDATDVATRKALSKAGSMIRQTARRSMRSRKKPSAPGSPPSAHRKSDTHPRGPLLKDKLFFAYEPNRRSVVTGPEKLGRSNAPEVMEKGGTVKVKVRPAPTGKPRSAASVAAFRRKLAAGTLKTKPKATESTRDVKIAERPFMVPALNKEKPKLAGLWADSVKP
jgi:hypothetical protein|tara:strand:+ start:9959 stop:10507 length:549 start_codon:yes stop_codon:yes gene_type:complete